jgi:hypothetical protein
MPLNEVEIFKTCLKDSATGRDRENTDLAARLGYTGPERNKSALQALMRMWSAVSKYVRNQVSKSNGVLVPHLGKFLPIGELGEKVTAFQPSIDFVDKG